MHDAESDLFTSKYWVMLVLAVVTTQQHGNQDRRNTGPPDRTQRLSVTAFVLGNVQFIRVDFRDNLAQRVLSTDISCNPRKDNLQFVPTSFVSLRLACRLQAWHQVEKKRLRTSYRAAVQRCR